MKRRAFITLLGGAAAWPLPAPAQQRQRMRRVGILMPYPPSDAEAQTRVKAFKEEMRSRDWVAGETVHFDERWTTDNMDLVRSAAANLVELKTDVILAGGGYVVGPLLQTRTVPIVFAQTPDPVGAGLVADLARPGGNATGFTLLEFGTSAKWLELLKEIAPGVRRAAVIGDTTIATGFGQFAELQAAAPSLGIELDAVDVRDAGEIERILSSRPRITPQQG
jgi:putative tryptophan/tyrosine transport system substrate-binding protein